MAAGCITDVPGILVGHYTDREGGTGLTVVLGPPEGMVAGAAVRGRATGTRELDALAPRHLVSRIHAVLLTGGSAYGLGAADGVMRWLRERDRGYRIGAGVVPIVPAAVIFDLGIVGRSDRWPGPEEAYAACDAAGRGVAEGSVGVGTGATVGKVLGPAGAMKGGVGTWAATRGELVVGALAVTNPFGDVLDASGRILAGARREDGSFVDARAYLAAGNVPFGAQSGPGTNTTLVVVATNARLNRGQLAEVATMAVDGLARRVSPAGTQYDGDLVFAVSTASLDGVAPLTVEVLAHEATAEAIERSVRLAQGAPGVPGLAD